MSLLSDGRPNLEAEEDPNYKDHHKQVDAIMRSQATRDERLRAADDVIENSDRIEALGGRVQELHAQYMAIAQQTSQERHSNAGHGDRRTKHPISGG